MPAIQVLRLCEVGVAANSNRAEPRSATHRKARIDLGRGAFMRGAVARAVDQPQDFSRIGQGDGQRVISPLAFVGDVHSLFALTVRLHDRSVGVDDRLLEKRLRLAGPGVAPRLVDRLLQVIEILRTKTTAEVPGRGRIGNAPSAQGIEIGFILAPQLQVLQAATIAQRVVGDVQHVIGFVIGPVDLEQVQPSVDGLRQAERLCQLMHQTDPAIRRADGSLRHFILNVRRPEHGLFQIVWEAEFVQPLHDSPLACPTATRHNSVHSKSLREIGASFARHK